ncbi:aquaporin-like protein [Cenococcum geophilum 1.58]|uniref:aquaporin-like protein n=1 Tax=Cenococcum geophilum 1.58 TaxID=794803 RepID=UPI00358DEC19|nr:aquaporin-like protein [Cenococcum geophilum 1.58]
MRKDFDPNNENERGQRRPIPFLSNRARNEIVAFVAEFGGTFMFLFFAFGATQVANAAAVVVNGAGGQQENHLITQAPNTSVLLFISLASGFSLAVNVWVFFRISGGLFNPAVTLGLYLIGAINPLRAVLCFIAQMLASIAAAGVVSAILPGPLNVSTSLGGGTTITQGVFLEMFLTAELIFTIFMLAAEKHKATYLAPIGIGLSLFMVELTGAFFTGGSLNPARSLGPSIVTHSFSGYHWIYWVGPFMGTLLAVGFYKLMKTVEYQTVNPGQDFNDHEAELFEPPPVPATAEEVRRPNVAAIAVEGMVRTASLGDRVDREKFKHADALGKILEVSGVDDL